MFGVDFSGSRTPGKKIWISEATPKSNSLEITNCRPAIERFDLHARPERDEVYKELKRLVRTHPSALFGFDFPFSLPEPLIDDVGSWRDHLERFDQRLGHKSADEFRKICVGRAAVKAGESGYLRRETDWRYGGQCPYQHQIVHQCCYGQRDFLAFLITNDVARALPMQTPSKGFPWLIEVYPAATLSRLGLYRQGCKNHSGSEERRARNVEGMRQEGIQISASIADRCRKSDDAHDSLTAAVGTFRALKNGFPKDSGGADIEGQIFA